VSLSSLVNLLPLLFPLPAGGAGGAGGSLRLMEREGVVDDVDACRRSPSTGTADALTAEMPCSWEESSGPRKKKKSLS